MHRAAKARHPRVAVTMRGAPYAMRYSWESDG
jgi:hypothetical protein